MKSGPRLLSARIDLTPLGLHLLHQMGRAEPESYLILQGCSYKDCNPVPWAAGSDRGNETQSTSEIILLPAVWWQRGGHVAGVCVCVCLVVGVDTVVGKVLSQACQPLKYTS